MVMTAMMVLNADGNGDDDGDDDANGNRDGGVDGDGRAHHAAGPWCARRCGRAGEGENH